MPVPPPCPTVPPRSRRVFSFKRVASHCAQSSIWFCSDLVTSEPIPTQGRDQKNFRAGSRSYGMYRSAVLPLDEQAGPQPLRTRDTGEMTKRYSQRDSQIHGLRQVPISPEWLNQPHSRFPAAARLSKYLLHVKIHLILHDEVTCLAHLACQRLRRHHLLAARQLPLVPALRFRTIPSNEVRRFHVRPT